MITNDYQWFKYTFENGSGMTDQETPDRYSQFIKKLKSGKKWFEEEEKLNSEYIQSENQSNEKQEVKV